MSDHPRGSTYEVNIKKLYDIMNLEKNWNGNNADPIPENVIDNAHVLLDRVRDLKPEIFPTATDSIQFEWFNDNDAYLEVEVRADNTATLFSTKNGASPETNVFYREIPFDTIEIENYVKRFLYCEHLL